jgi:peroxin-2
MRRKITRNLSKIQFSALLPQGLRTQTPKESDTIETKRGRFYLLPENQCAICAEDASMDVSLLKEINSANQQLQGGNPTLNAPKASEVPAYPINTPYKVSCGHVYCYVCIADRLLRAVDEGENYWECLRCDERVYNAGRWEIERYRSQPTSGSVDQWRAGTPYGHDATESEGSELSGMDFDSVSSIGLRTYSGSGDLSG